MAASGTSRQEEDYRWSAMQQNGEECREPNSSSSLDRDSFLDNYKGLAILFILCIHGEIVLFILVGPQLLDSLAGRIYVSFVSLLYLVAMPAFCFISGLLSPKSLQRKHVVRCIRYFGAYLFWHTLTVLAMAGAPSPGNSAFTIKFWSADGVEWYLASLIIWRLLFLPVFSLLRWPITVSIVVAVFMMMTDTMLCSQASCTFGFFPFFMAGASFRGRLRDIRLETPGWAQGLILGGLTASVVLMVTLGREWIVFPRRLLGCIYGGETGAGIAEPDSIRAAMNATHPYVPPPATDFCATVPGVVEMAAFYPAVFALLAIFGALVSERRVMFVTRAGSNSLYIYLTHYTVLAPAVMLAAGAATEGWSSPAVPSTLATLCVVLCTWVLLSGEWIKCVCGPCVEPPVERCLLSDDRDIL